MLTEGQITNEKFLAYINDFLSSGEIADLYTNEEKDAIINEIKPEVQGEGIADDKENCWNYFISRIRRNLHMSLFFSPMGETFRNTAAKFPAIINSTVIDWFHPWSEEALLSVSKKYTEELEFYTDEARGAVEKFMPYSFKVVVEASEKFNEVENRSVYTTPKSFLEFINQFKAMFTKAKGEIEANKKRCELGVDTLKEAIENVIKLEEALQKHLDEIAGKEGSKDESDKSAKKLEIVQRLISSLKSESERYEAAALKLSDKLKVFVGDLLLASAFVSYAGPFNRAFRDMIIQEKFIAFLHESQIPMSEDSNPISILTDEATINEWKNCKLPADQMSIENG